MYWVAILLTAIALGLAQWFLIVFRRESKEEGSFPYVLRSTLFTPAEKSFCHVLQQAVNGKALVFGKVRVADVLATKKGLDNSKRASAFNKISKKHFDFVLCNPQDLKILCAIELDDRSHNAPKRKARDTFLDEACKAANFRLIHIQAKRSYELTQVKYVVDTILTHS